MSPSETSDPWTVSRMIAWAADEFRSKGSDSPRLDAELLLGRILDKDRVALIMEAGRPLNDDELRAFKQLVVRRRRGEPIAYILGQREFYGHVFRVDKNVLVPRPDTEILVGLALKETQKNDQFGLALDLCTGSGCVAVSFALERPNWRVTATDLSAGALGVARANAERLGASWSLNFREGSLFECIAPGTKFDVIVSNPPYIPSGEIAELKADIKDFEPRIALDGGPKGFDLVDVIIQQAPNFLAPGGLLALEIGAGQAPHTASLMRAQGFGDTASHADYGHIERVVTGRIAERDA